MLLSVASNRLCALPRQSLAFCFNQVLVLHEDSRHHHVSGFRYGLHEMEGS